MDIYGDNLLSNSRGNLGPINRNRGDKWYLALLVIGKSLFVIGVFLSYTVLKSIPLVQYLFAVKLCSSIILILVQKPKSSGSKINGNQWRHIILYSILSVILTLLWLEALTVCGPVRTILLSQQSDALIVALLNMMLQRGNALPSRSRGAMFYLAGLWCMLFFDHDQHSLHEHSGDTHQFSTHIYHHAMEIFSWLGLPDHMGGIAMLLVVSLIRVFVNNYGKKVSSQIGSSRRLYALSTGIETSLLIPWIIWSVFNSTKEQDSSIMLHLPVLALIVFFVFICNFYIESISLNHLESFRTFRVGSIASFGLSILVGFFWEHADNVEFKHSISTGVVIAMLFFMLATRLLVQSSAIKSGASKGTLIGYSTSGLPLYSFSGPDGSVPKSVFVKLRSYLIQVLENEDSRSILFYLCLNLMFTFVELMYGVWTNSLGLISDGFHMLFDCSALVLGLWAAIASKWKSTKTFSFGYGRIEVLSGFVNGLFLVVIATFVFLTAVRRLMDPPQVNTEKLLAVSVAGFLVNMVGIFAFSHAHSHGGKSCDHGHSHANSSSHEHGGHGHHSHGGHEHGHSHDDGKGKSGHKSANMQGVFLHVLADTLGSVGVIISSILIEQYQWYIADPICSLFIAVMIMLSVIPLLRQSSLVLLQRTPKELEQRLRDAMNRVKFVDGVLTYKDLHVWEHSSESLVGTLVVQITPTASEQRILSKVRAVLKDSGIQNISVQLEKEAFYQHMSKFSTGYYSVVPFPFGSNDYQIEEDSDDSFVRVKNI